MLTRLPLLPALFIAATLASPARAEPDTPISPYSLDPLFASTADAEVRALAVAADGDIYIGGAFWTVNGQPRKYLARLAPDGSLTPTAQFGAAIDGSLYGVLVQPDGKLVVAGSFSEVNGQPRMSLARLHHNGTLDAGFNAPVDQPPWALASQADGRLLVAGPFASVGGLPRWGIARLTADGQTDISFAPAIAHAVYASIAVQPDGRIVVAGLEVIDNELRSVVRRLLANGQPDPSFAVPTIGPISTGRAVVVSLQPDGKILIGGSFGHVNGAPRQHLARLNADGSLDTGFVADSNRVIHSLALQADGRVIASGLDWFETLPQERVFRLLPNGQLDPSFAVAFEGNGDTSVTLQADGKPLVGGLFTQINGLPRSNLARLQATTPAVSALRRESGGVTWQRGGTAPELVRAPTLSVSTDGGASFTQVAVMTRVSAGWRIDGYVPPSGPDVVLRAQGHSVGGRNNGSQSLIEAHLSLGDAIFASGFESQ